MMAFGRMTTGLAFFSPSFVSGVIFMEKDGLGGQRYHFVTTGSRGIYWSLGKEFIVSLIHPAAYCQEAYFRAGTT